MLVRPPSFLASLIGAGLFLTACGSSKPPTDQFNGFIDPTILNLDGGFAESTSRTSCPQGTPCYPAQVGFAHGAPFSFFNVYTQQTKTLFFADGGTAIPTPTKSTWAYTFGDGCKGTSSFDPLTDTYPNNQQYAVFTAIPAGTSLAAGLPLVRPTTVTGLPSGTGYECNDIKDAQYIGLPGAPAGVQGAQTGTVGDLQLWPVIDPAATLYVPNDGGLNNVKPQFGWYRGLLLTYLNGGPVPTADDGGILVNTGVLLNRADGGFGQPNDAKGVVLAHTPGEPGYSPIVQLYSYPSAAGSPPPAAVTSVCGGVTNIPCTVGGKPGELDITTAAKTPFNTIFIVASPQ